MMMKQKNKLRKALSVGLFCLSLFLLVGMVGCSKNVGLEAEIVTKAGVGSEVNPYTPDSGYMPYVGENWTYFDMRDKTFLFQTYIPASKHEMIIAVKGEAVTRTLSFNLQNYSLSERKTISTSEGTLIVDYTPAACGDIQRYYLPSGYVTVKMESTTTSVMGIKLSFYEYPPGPMPPAGGGGGQGQGPGPRPRSL